MFCVSGDIGGYAKLWCITGLAVGRLVVVPALSEVQEAHFQEPTVLLVQHIGGEEDIPEVTKQTCSPSSHHKLGACRAIWYLAFVCFLALYSPDCWQSTSQAPQLQRDFVQWKGCLLWLTLLSYPLLQETVLQ